MPFSVSKLSISNFKSYREPQTIELKNLSVLLGANSSGKSTTIQTLLLLKQTIECNNPDIDLLLSGKYVTVGDFDEAINDRENCELSIGVERDPGSGPLGDEDEKLTINWHFVRKDTKHNHAMLKSVEMNSAYGAYALVSQDPNPNLYRCYKEGSKTCYSVEISGLRCGRIYIGYNSEFNESFRSFLSDLSTVLFGEKQSPELKRDRICALSGVQAFYGVFLQSLNNVYGIMAEQAPKDTQKEELVRKIIDHISECADLQCSDSHRTDVFPPYIKEYFLLSAIDSEEKKTQICELLSLHRQQFARYSDLLASNELPIDRWDRLPPPIFSNDNDEESCVYDELRSLIRLYMELQEELKNEVYYIGPIREKPLGLYNIGFESSPKYVGTTGAFFASVLMHENKGKEYIMPFGSAQSTLTAALSDWLQYMDIAMEAKSEMRSSFGSSVTITNTNNVSSDIVNVGIGTSQVLPVLIQGLLSEKGEALIFEQPELHLHPYSQSRLADFFVALAKNGRKVIVETHSEYIILRLRYHLLTKGISPDRIAVTFFSNSCGTKAQPAAIDGYGDIQYPDGFQDTTEQLITQLFTTSMKRKDDP